MFMPGPYGPTTFDSPNPLDVEVAILEIIDNSIDAGATNIHLLIERDQITTDSLAVRVYDNGTKVNEREWTQQDIEDAFNIEIDPNDPEIERDPESIGKFHVGMKIAPLTKFNYISMFTMSGDNLLQMHGMYPEYRKIRETPELIYGGELNPIQDTPDHIDTNQISNYFTENGMNTCVVMTSPRVKLLPSTTETDFSRLRYFRLHMRSYLGLVYQKHLEDDAVSIRVSGIAEADDGPNVIALDPFWSNFTPENIIAHRDTEFEQGNLEEGEFDQLTNLARFGTMKTPRMPIEVNGHTIYVEGFIVPHRTSRTALLNYWEDGNFDDNHTIVKNKFKVANSGSEKLAGTNLSGFFFYRGKRCINFGGDLHNNQGFYDLISPQNSHWVWRLRIKVEYPEDVLDDRFQLHPNKKGYIAIDQGVWDQIKLTLSVHLGGQQYARPFNQARAFVLWNDSDNQFEKTGQSTQFSYSACANCNLKIHEAEDICPAVNCPQCGNSGIGCSTLICRHVCTFCNREECPGEAECELNCEFCDEVIMHEDVSECVNHCRICQSFDCNCQDEEAPDEEPEETEHENNPESSTIEIHHEDEEVELLLVKQNKQENIDCINDALLFLEISIDELSSD
jgi:hypothetical protein